MHVIQNRNHKVLLKLHIPILSVRTNCSNNCGKVIIIDIDDILTIWIG